MLRVKGVYDGEEVILLDPLPVLADATVEVLIAEATAEVEQRYWQRLLDLGLIKEIRATPMDELTFEPVNATGTPISQTLVEERR